MSRSALSSGPRPRRVRTLHCVVLHGAAMLLIAAAARAQDTAAARKPVPATPAPAVPTTGAPASAPATGIPAAAPRADTTGSPVGAPATAPSASAPAGAATPAGAIQVIAAPAPVSATALRDSNVPPPRNPALDSATAAVAKLAGQPAATPAAARDSGAATPAIPAAVPVAPVAAAGTSVTTPAASVDTSAARIAPAHSAIAAPPAPAASAAVPPASPGTSKAAASTATAPIAAAAETPASELANPFVQRAVSLYEQGKDEAAITEYRKGLANDPLDSDTWYGLAELYRELGRTRQAIETYTLALATIEHAPELRLPFAELLMASRRKPDAIKVLQRGIELDPDASAEMKAMLGNVVLGVLDDAGAVKGDSAPAATAAGMPAATSRSASATGRTRPKIDRKKRKKLCKLFCAGAFDPIAPKPK